MFRSGSFSSDILAGGTSLKLPVRIPAFRKHFGIVSVPTCFQASATYLMACRILSDFVTSEAVVNSSILARTCWKRCFLQNTLKFLIIPKSSGWRTDICRQKHNVDVSVLVLHFCRMTTSKVHEQQTEWHLLEGTCLLHERTWFKMSPFIQVFFRLKYYRKLACVHVFEALRFFWFPDDNRLGFTGTKCR